MRFKFTLIAVLFLSAVCFGQTALSDVVPVITYGLQPSGSDSLHWTAGKYVTVARNGNAKIARGFDVVSTSSGGNLKVHLLNDYNAKKQKVWLVYPIPASGGAVQRVGLIFDEVDSTGTTISKSDLIIWY